jgi:hypothetical protein
MTDANAGPTYRVLRRLPPFYTLQPNAQTRSKQLQCWAEFVLDAAAAAHRESGCLGIQLHPHSALFRAPRELGRVLPAAGARAVLRHLMEVHGGYRCLPLALDVAAGDADADSAAAATAAAAAAHAAREDADGFDDAGEGVGASGADAATAGDGAVFANCDALLVLALPCERLIDCAAAWAARQPVVRVFTLGELASDADLTARLDAAIDGGASVGEPITVAGAVAVAATAKPPPVQAAVVCVAVDAATVFETVMTADHPALAHAKRPALIAAAGGAIGLKFSD